MQRRETVVDDSYHRRQARDYRCKSWTSANMVYRDRPGGHDSNYRYDYYDRYHRSCSRIIWPRYRCHVYYPFHTTPIISGYYPYYHRKYCFVSLSGWWPSYSCMRYYWYGWHPYQWYGYSPVPYEVSGDTANYYTYNYYTVDNSEGVYSTGVSPSSEPMPGAMTPTAPDTYVAPSPEGPADQYFAAGVKAFEQGQYLMAASSFQQAMNQAPEDVILPFAYAQALFAAEQYNDAYAVLTLTLTKIPKQGAEVGVFYPRGLYQDDDALYAHIDQFMDYQENNPDDPGLRLLLGYHLLGIGEVGLAREYLVPTGQDRTYDASVAVLDRLAQRLEIESPVIKTEQTD